MSMDGWSNVHNKPIVCVAVTSNYKTYVIDSVDTEPSHTGDVLKDIMEKSIKKAKEKYQCTTGKLLLIHIVKQYFLNSCQYLFRPF